MRHWSQNLAKSLNLSRDTSLPFFAGGILVGLGGIFARLGGTRWDFQLARWDFRLTRWDLPFCCSVWECGGTLGLLFPGGMGGGSGGSGPKALSPQTSVRQEQRAD